MNRVTCWYVRDDKGALHYNHLSDGWAMMPHPHAKFPNQERSWKNLDWIPVITFIKDGVVQKVPSEEQSRIRQ